ncbi:hypothetical protein HNO88_002780 [Novosphingobium chloroacetimidivorans]|uniref:Uncharacterized protein n=1 Tax=Novosphingobium chloroacetimidivorans TaxID=1428314 RepID=A0A7W7KAZ1_9SPHN|nr:hypothetical protein [Novosphingobium chloroacetimidivorans]MBB4859451.1 hypothetical protein [Novosphingobium chloroacetimidivorans]
MNTPLDRDDIAIMIGNEIATWTNVTSPKVLERALRALADKLCDYAHLHYTSGQLSFDQVKSWINEAKPTILPGLPGGA